MLEALSLHNTASHRRGQSTWYSHADHTGTRLNVDFFPYENGDTYLTSTRNGDGKIIALSYQDYSVDESLREVSPASRYAIRMVNRHFHPNESGSPAIGTSGENKPAVRLVEGGFIRDDINRLVWMLCPLGTRQADDGVCSGAPALLDSTSSAPSVWSHLSGISPSELGRNWRLPSTAELQSLFTCVQGKPFKASFPEQPPEAFLSTSALASMYQEKFDSACLALQSQNAESLTKSLGALPDGYYLALIDDHIGQGIAFRSNWETGRVQLTNGKLSTGENKATDDPQGFVLLVKAKQIDAMLERSSAAEAEQLAAQAASLLEQTAPRPTSPAPSRPRAQETTTTATATITAEPDSEPATKQEDVTPAKPIYRVDIHNQRYHPLTSGANVGIFMLNGREGAEVVDLHNALVWRFCPAYADFAWGPGNSIGCNEDNPPELSHDEFSKYYDEIIGDNVSSIDAEWRLPTETEINAFYACLNGKASDGSPCEVAIRGIEENNPVFYQYPHGRFLVASPRGRQIAHTYQGEIKAVASARSTDKALVRLVRPASEREMQAARRYLR